MLFRTIALILVVAHIQGETLHEKKVIRASFDRIEGDFAVVYSDHDEDDDHHNNNKFDVPLELLKDAKPGMRLKLHIENDQIKRIEIDKETTERARDRIHKKYERLRQGRHLR
jgi:hypothetical protein